MPGGLISSALNCSHAYYVVPTRLDIIRAFSIPERLCFSQNLRQKLLSLCDLRFEAVNGCPRELVLIIGDVLEHAKAYLAGNIGLKDYSDALQVSIRKMYSWDSSRCFYPDEDSLWAYVAEAFRHSLILRAWRLLDPTEPASEKHIQDSVTAILDSVAEIPGSSPLVELLVLPLFMAGADSLSPHSRHYVLLRIAEIKARSEMGLEAPQDLLKKVWQARAQQPKGDTSNVSWILFVSPLSPSLNIEYLLSADIKFRIRAARRLFDHIICCICFIKILRMSSSTFSRASLRSSFQIA